MNNKKNEEVTGITCGVCFNNASTTVSTEYGNGTIVRKRACLNCGNVFETTEVLGISYNLDKFIEGGKKILQMSETANAAAKGIDDMGSMMRSMRAIAAIAEAALNKEKKPIKITSLSPVEGVPEIDADGSYINSADST